MKQTEAIEILTTVRYDLAQVIGVERALEEHQEPAIAQLDVPRATAMMAFEAIVSQAPDRQWLDDVADRAGINIETIAHGVLTLQRAMYTMVSTKLEFPQEAEHDPTTHDPVWFWMVLTGIFFLLSSILVGYLLGPLLIH